MNQLVWNDESLNCSDGKMETDGKIPILDPHWKQAPILRMTKILGHNCLRKNERGKPFVR